MTGIEIFTLILLAVFIVIGIVHQYSKHQDLLEDTIKDAKDIEVKSEQVIDELYNKDLRPIVAKKAPKKEKVEETKPEFPIEKPKKKRKYYPRKKK